jgi:Spy/CpxP family protein refolding chaperone
MKKRSLAFIVFFGALSLLGGNHVLAQTPAAQPAKSDPMPRAAANGDNSQAPTDEDIQLFRKDVRSMKKQVVAANLSLTDTEAEKFWPVYDQYTSDLGKINDTKADLIKDYLQNYTTMTGDQAEAYIRKRAAVEQSVMALRLKYIPAFRKVLSGRETAQFFQIDYRLGLMIDLQLSQMPLIDP